MQSRFCKAQPEERPLHIYSPQQSFIRFRYWIHKACLQILWETLGFGQCLFECVEKVVLWSADEYCAMHLFDTTLEQ